MAFDVPGCLDNVHPMPWSALAQCSQPELPANADEEINQIFGEEFNPSLEEWAEPFQRSRDLSAELWPMCNSYRSVSGKCQCLLGHALNIIEQMCREPFIHSAASSEWGIMHPFYIFKSSVKICLKRRVLSAACCHSCSKTSGFFPPVFKINYTENKDLTIQSQVVQTMKIHSEFCFFVFDRIYVHLSSDREFFIKNSS